MGLKKDALSYSKLGDFSKAQKTIKKALELKPNSKNLVHELAKINLKSKNYELSLELLLGLEDKVDKKSIESGTGVAQEKVILINFSSH